MTARSRPWLAGLRPYRPGSHEALEAGMLASNESPFRASATLPEAITAAIGSLHRYPDPTATRLREQLADLHDVDPEYLLVGNGSDELIYLLTWAFAAGGSVVCADPAYQLDVITAQVARAEVHQVPLVDWHHDLTAMAAVEADLAYVVNPHNPTGTAHPLEAITAFAGSSHADLLVVDEAYIDFASVDSALPLAREGKAVVLRTLSKLYGLAGARIGYLIGDPAVLDVLRSIRPPFSVNTLAQAAASAALGDTEHTRRALIATLRNRDRLRDLLRSHGLRPVASEANFILVPGVDERRFVGTAADLGVAIRPGTSLGVPGAVRITVPDDAGLALLEPVIAAYARDSPGVTEV